MIKVSVWIYVVLILSTTVMGLDDRQQIFEQLKESDPLEGLEQFDKVYQSCVENKTQRNMLLGMVVSILLTPLVVPALGAAGLLGVASTGTAISSLSGAALSSASFAALGGGAIAAGGGGMILGTMISGNVISTVTKATFDNLGYQECVQRALNHISNTTYIQYYCFEIDGDVQAVRIRYSGLDYVGAAYIEPYNC